MSCLVLPTDFRVSVSFTETDVVLAIAGELDIASAGELNALFDAMFDRGHDSVVLDLSGLAFMDGRVLHVVANAARRLLALQGRLTLRSPSAVVRRVLEVNGLMALVQLAPLAGEQSPLGPVQMTTAAREDGQFDQPGLAIPMEREVLGRALGLVVNLTKMSIRGADGASVSLLRDGKITTVAASDQTVMAMDAGQYSSGEGPCLDASIQGRWFHVNSLQDEARWPTFVPLARSLGINAILSNPLTSRSRQVGALNIYSRTTDSFGPAEQALASALAAETSGILSAIGIGAAAQSQAERLQQALRSREVIAQAQGIVMERAGVSEEMAFAHLRKFLQETGRPLREGAEDIVESTRWREAVIEENPGSS